MVIFLKLGGSLITDKTKPYCAHPETIYRIGLEIQSTLKEIPETRLVIGHGSGSFGHEAAAEHNTRRGVSTQEEWLGFIEVWKAARALNTIVTNELGRSGLPVISLSPSASLIGANREIVSWNIDPIRSALSSSLIPIIHGDVIFDTRLGGTIISTEELFVQLAHRIPPARILLAGIEKGVYSDFPNKTEIYPIIDHKNYETVIKTVQGSASKDVTGGMASKVTAMANLWREIQELNVSIFSGQIEGNVSRALRGETFGTQIRF